MTRGARRAIRLGAIAVLLVLVALFARHVDWPAAARAVRGADPLLLGVALVANLLSLTLKGARWWLFLRALGVRSLALVLRATYAGAALNNLVVAQGGEGARALAVARGAGVPVTDVVAALTIERLFDAASYLVLLVAGAWLLPLPPALLRWRGAAVILLALLGLLIGWATLRTPSADAPAPRGRLALFARRFGGSVSMLGDPARLAGAALLSAGAWALQLWCYHLTALAAHVSVPISGSLAALLTVGVSFLIRATPGNVGVFQVVYALTLHSFGVGEAEALGAALLIQTVQVVPVMVLGGMTMMKRM